MYEEKRVWTAFKLSRIFRKHSTFYAFKTKKNESLTHSLFLEGSRSKVIFRVTRKPCSARLPTAPPAPDGWCLSALGVVVAMPQSYSVSPERPSDGRTFGHSVGAYLSANGTLFRHLPMVGVSYVQSVTSKT